MNIDFKDVWYEVGGHAIIKGVTFSVADSGNWVILGSSGSGKTTLLRLLLGLITPNRGEIIVDGQDVVKMNKQQLNRFRKRLAVVFQHAALFDSLTVEENVGYRLMEEELLSFKEIKKIVSEALIFVGLGGEEKKMPWELSGGMKKRVAIARALASGADTILFDEPTAGLDPINANNITKFITHLRDSHSITSIVVTHDLYCAFEVATRVGLLDQGELIFDGTVADVRRSKDKRVTSFVSPSEGDLVSSRMDEIMKLSRKRLEHLT